jgi:hypothetical protein
MEPVPVEVDLVPPPGIAADATILATVQEPVGLTWWTSALPLREGNRYSAPQPLLLPLEPPDGDWRLLIFVQSTLDVEGERELTFRPAAIPFHDLAAELPAAVDLRVPQEFLESASQGDQGAGGRTWRYEEGELGLWWAPGPVEPLLFDNALVFLETTHDPDAPPAVLNVEEIDWAGQTAFLFREQWPGSDGGPAEVLVIQGPDYFLYLLRIRVLGADTIPPILHQVRDTFTFLHE